MPYITIPATIRHHQLTIDDFLAVPGSKFSYSGPAGHIGDTRTYYQENPPERLRSTEVAANCITLLDQFVERHSALYEVERETLYHHFTIPKRNGKRRPIDAPLPQLMEALRELKLIFEGACCVLNHTSAFAYVKNRSTLEAVKRHQTNKSRWFLKTDCSDFFPSTTLQFTMNTISDIWPFSEIVKNEHGKAVLEKALDLCFLRGGLPQGTPISPMLTNLVMIPIDHDLMNGLRDFEGSHLIYTRYADDMQISARNEFDWQKVCAYIQGVFKKHNAPYSLKREKTHYGSCAGRNWILGVMYNKDQQITLGKKRKDALRASICDYMRNRGTRNALSYGDLQSLNGTISYFKKIEPEYTDGLLSHYSKKFDANVLASLREDLRNI